MMRRRNRGGVGRVSAFSKRCRIVNGGGDDGFVNHCDQVLDDQNKMVMAVSKIAVDPGSDQTVASINHRVYRPATNNLSKLKARSFLNHKLKDESSKSVALLNKKILQLTNKVNYLKQKLAVANQYRAKPVAREKNLDVLPFTQVSSTCSSGIGNFSLAEIQDQQERQDIKLKKRRTRPAATKQPNPDPLEYNQTKQRRTIITRAKSAKIGKMQELSLITTDDAYNTCLENYNPTKDEPVSKNTKSNLETPSWRVIKYSGRRSVKDTEIMSDRIFEKRHHKHEQKEQICKRRDLRRLRELIRVENLKQGRNKHQIQDQQEQRDIKLKKQRTRQAATKQPNPDSLESNETKQRRTIITRAKSAKIGKMQELSLITADDAYNTCLENYDPTKDEPVSKNTKSNLETPSWRVIKYSGKRSVKGTEIMSDRIFEKRHHKHEQKEQICKRQDLRRSRELIRVENLKQGRNKHQIQDQQEQRDIKLKKQRTRQAATKQPNPDPLESNQIKQRRTIITRAKSGKMQELSLITADDAYNTCLENYDPTKDEPVSKNTKSNLETPSWRVIKYSGRRSVKGTEIMSDRIFEKRHHKHEQKEQICKRRDLRRLRELIRVENLKQGRYKHHSQKSNNKKELTTLLPSPSNIKAIEITDKLPESAFECNLYNLNC
ncbi:uncharacterized protein LOC132935461 isoform X2 [Metopolophium dirhodum]|uniref:uncharacterized protein LOC132935461 isoform X2 n=1 Tax=Metopolophium dirhodum TaxID=44670 RepID=UPI0029900023|nr:uncharacterized protein LOC132935461 isoform X2 [Metopolophium dirhodum]